jgi:hypothetical protein
VKLPLKRKENELFYHICYNHGHINSKINMTFKMMKIYPLILISLFFAAMLQAQVINNVSVKYLGRMWNAGQAEASIISQDGGFSYSVPGGSLWWFGDTFKGKRGKDGKANFEGGAVSCCTAFLNGQNKELPPVLKYMTNKEGSVEQAIQFLPGESWDHNRIWPMAGIYVKGKSYIYYSLIEITGKGEWDFKSAGFGLACSKEPFNIHKRILSKGEWRFPVNPTAIVEKGEWIYLYEVEKRGNKQGIWLARVKKSEIENPDAYSYYYGEGNYGTDKSRQVLFVENIFGQVSIVWNEYLKQYLLVSSSDFTRPLEIRFYTAANPDGKFVKSPTSVTAPFILQGKKVNLVYCSYLHPELFREKGRVINISFSLNLKDSSFDANNEMIEVEFN